MLILADTNILLRAVKRDDDDYQLTIEVLSILHEKGHVPAMVPQCGYEYYVVATRPAKENGLGRRPDDAIEDLHKLITLFRRCVTNALSLSPGDK